MSDPGGGAALRTAAALALGAAVSLALARALAHIDARRD